MKRTELRRYTPLRSRPREYGTIPARTALRAVSKRRQREGRQYTRLRAAFLADHPRCEFPGGCAFPATEIQHRRGRTGERLLDVTWWAATCHEHNQWAEMHTGAALAMGWLVRIEGAA